MWIRRDVAEAWSGTCLVRSRQGDSDDASRIMATVECIVFHHRAPVYRVCSSPSSGEDTDDGEGEKTEEEKH